ncbi:hypothetical protein LZ023_27635 [Pseudomonas silvicola]|nr:hypothetical protein LZ023_27635 [Pseudomonas silvicola]
MTLPSAVGLQTGVTIFRHGEFRLHFNVQDFAEKNSAKNVEYFSAGV